MAEKFANTGAASITQISANITGNQTTIPVKLAEASLPKQLKGGTFRIEVDKEIMRVLSISGTTWTVERNIEETAEEPHAANAFVFHKLSQGGLLQAIQDAFGVGLEVTGGDSTTPVGQRAEIVLGSSNNVLLVVRGRADTAINWTNNDPELAIGELGFEEDTGKGKVGKFVGGKLGKWSQLGYSFGVPGAGSYSTTETLEKFLGIETTAGGGKVKGPFVLEGVPKIIKLSPLEIKWEPVAGGPGGVDLAEVAEHFIEVDTGEKMKITGSPPSSESFIVVGESNVGTYEDARAVIERIGQVKLKSINMTATGTASLETNIVHTGSANIKIKLPKDEFSSGSIISIENGTLDKVTTVEPISGTHLYDKEEVASLKLEPGERYTFISTFVPGSGWATYSSFFTQAELDARYKLVEKGTREGIIKAGGYSATGLLKGAKGVKDGTWIGFVNGKAPEATAPAPFKTRDWAWDEADDTVWICTDGQGTAFTTIATGYTTLAKAANKGELLTTTYTTLAKAANKEAYTTLVKQAAKAATSLEVFASTPPVAAPFPVRVGTEAATVTSVETVSGKFIWNLSAPLAVAHTAGSNVYWGTKTIEVAAASPPTAAPFPISVGTLIDYEEMEVTAVAGKVWTVKRSEESSEKDHLSGANVYWKRKAIEVAAASPPTAAPFFIAIDSEVMKVTSVSGKVWSCERAQEGTVEADHASGANVAKDLAKGDTSVEVTSSTTPAATPFLVAIDNELVEVTAAASKVWTIVRKKEATTEANHLPGANIVYERAGKWVNSRNYIYNTRDKLGGYLAQSFDLSAATKTDLKPVTKTLYLVKLDWPATKSVAGITTMLKKKGTLTYARMGLYSSTGEFLAKTESLTGNSKWGKVSPAEDFISAKLVDSSNVVTPATIPGGNEAFIWAGILVEGTEPELYGASFPGTSEMFNANLVAAKMRIGTNANGGKLVLPEAIELKTSENSKVAGLPFWIGLI